MKNHNRLKRVLIVDHDHPLRDDLVDMLNGRGIHTVLCANAKSAKNAIEEVHETECLPFQMILLGPLASYWETVDVMQNIRANENLKNVPVILMSAYYYSPLFQAQAKQFSPADYLVRPISAQGLFEHIYRWD